MSGDSLIAAHFVISVVNDENQNLARLVSICAFGVHLGWVALK